MQTLSVFVWPDRMVWSDAWLALAAINQQSFRDLRPDDDARYRTLRLCCNWIVHVDLKNRHAQEIINTADECYAKLLNGTLTTQEKDNFRQLFTLNTFREELSDFLRQHRLRSLTDDEWNSFLACFLNVIEDCPLHCQAQTGDFKEVDEVVLIKEVEDGGRVADGAPPRIIWALCYKGMHRMTIGANFSLSNDVIDALVDFNETRQQTY